MTKIERQISSLLLLIAGILVLCVILLPYAHAETRVPSAPTGAGAIFRNKPWNEVNKTWLLRPNSPNTTLTITVRNRNTTNAHSLNIFLLTTADETLCLPATDGCASSTLGWETISGVSSYDNGLGTNTCLTTPPSVSAATQSQICQWTFRNVKQIAITVTSAATAAGSPDTADMFYAFTPVNIVQFPLKWIAVVGRQSSNTAFGGQPVVVGGLLRSGNVSFPFMADTAGQKFAVPVQAATLLNGAPTISVANTAATVTLTGVLNKRICIRSISVKATGAAATSTLVVQDNAVTFLDFGTLTIPLAGAAINFFGSPLFCGTTGNNVQVAVGAGGAAAVTTTSVVADQD